MRRPPAAAQKGGKTISDKNAKICAAHRKENQKMLQLKNITKNYHAGESEQHTQ